MTLLTIDEIKEFERELDATLEALPSLRFDGEASSFLRARLYSTCRAALSP